MYIEQEIKPKDEQIIINNNNNNTILERMEKN